MLHVLAQQPLFIRVDAAPDMGIGHLVRCMSLARAWCHSGGRAVFISSLDGSHSLKSRILNAGFELFGISTPHPDAGDAIVTGNILRDAMGVSSAPCWLVVDGYHFDQAYHLAMKSMGIHLLLIDDLASLPEYNADIIVNQNSYAEKGLYGDKGGPISLVGVRYILLGSNFIKLAEGPLFHEKAGNLLITLGGGDVTDSVKCILSALFMIARPGLHVKIVLGPLVNGFDRISKDVSRLSCHVELIRDVRDMAPVIEWADMAISAGGTTCYELAFMGKPFIVVITAKNQERVAESFGKAGAAVNMGWLSRLKIEDLADAIHNLLLDTELRRRLCKAGSAMVDGKGAERVTDCMISFDPIIRRAVTRDMEDLYRWANDPSVRSFSFYPDKIKWEEHEKWFNARLADPDCILYVATTKAGDGIGQIRFDIVGDGGAVISISIDAALRGLGLGKRLLIQACRGFFSEYDVKYVDAFVRSENVPSLRAFAGAGFRKLSDGLQNGFSAVTMRLERGPAQWAER
ncbi:MAG: UDP-2,4-diacetamido-2,4,6-trideoxy-beta-L-altropyranose hydrolase [Desulfobacteraceae bacterium]|nr:UDP-2,4-diacetamido-2,4,6-trideoxy-beta-L-altropyranose hydrolase [Desulfobacteraceae bacterium]